MAETLEKLIETSTTVGGVHFAHVPPSSEFRMSNATTYAVRRSSPSVESLVRVGTGYGTVTDSSDRNFAASLRRLQEASQLTWGEIARVLGVSRRTVHNWLTTAKVNGENARRIGGLYRALTQELAATEREDAREYLLAPGPDGSTRLAVIARDLRTQYPRKQPGPGGFSILRSSGGVTRPDPVISGGLDQEIEMVETDGPF